jgi:hypothetical protein
VTTRAEAYVSVCGHGDPAVTVALQRHGAAENHM